MLAISQNEIGVLEMTLCDVIDADDITKLEQALGPYLTDEGSVNAVLDMTDASDQTGQNLAQDSHVAERLLCQLDKLGRIAVVSEADDLGAMVKAVDGLMPCGTLAKFHPDERDAARRFAAHLY